MARSRSDEVVNVTSAPQNRAEEIAGRQRKYLLSMGLRVVCFVAAIIVGHGWAMYALIGGALVLPYVAVIAANAVTAPAPGRPVESPGLTHPELTSGS